jgi:hypothetical protein
MGHTLSRYYHHVAKDCDWHLISDIAHEGQSALRSPGPVRDTNVTLFI